MTVCRVLVHALFFCILRSGLAQHLGSVRLCCKTLAWACTTPGRRCYKQQWFLSWVDQPTASHRHNRSMVRPLSRQGSKKSRRPGDPDQIFACWALGAGRARRAPVACLVMPHPAMRLDRSARITDPPWSAQWLRTRARTYVWRSNARGACLNCRTRATWFSSTEAFLQASVTSAGNNNH